MIGFRHRDGRARFHLAEISLDAVVRVCLGLLPSQTKQIPDPRRQFTTGLRRHKMLVDMSS